MNLLFLSVFALFSEQSLESAVKELNVVHSCRAISKSDTPKQTIIHLKDWHFVSEEDYNRDKDANGAERLPATYEKLLESVSKVQAQQEAVLRMLIAKHGLTTLHKEGWIVGEEFYPDDAKLVTSMSKVLWFPRALTKPELDSQRLNIGPAGKLLAEKKLKAVRSCEDFTLVEACNPFDEDGNPRDVPDKTLEARETFIVNHIIKSREKLSVVILGGAHDLSDNLPKGVRLIEVKVKAYHHVTAESESKAEKAKRLTKEAKALRAKGMDEKADEILKRIVEECPGTPEANEAADFLELLRKVRELINDRRKATEAGHPLKK